VLKKVGSEKKITDNLSLCSLNRAKSYLNKFLLLIFFIFVVSDLIEMHLKIICKVDLYLNHNPVNKTGSSHKVKDEKTVKAKNQHFGSGFLAFSSGLHFKIYARKVTFAFIYADLVPYKDFLFSVSPRAPPFV